MPRFLAAAGLAFCLMGIGANAFAAEYRLKLEPRASAAEVDLRLTGDADGETLLSRPSGLTAASGIRVTGGAAAVDGDRIRITHKPSAALRVRYAVPLAGAGGAAVIAGEEAFALPVERRSEAATLRLKAGRGLKVVSDVGAETAPLTQSELAQALVVVGPGLAPVERATPAGTLRVVAPSGEAARLADTAGAALAAGRAYVGAGPADLLVVGLPGAKTLAGARNVRIDPASADPARAAAEAWMTHWAVSELGEPKAAGALASGLAAFAADRAMLRAGLRTPADLADSLDAADHARDPASHARMLALRWDEQIRASSKGARDLDDVLLQMQAHAARFPSGQAPDLTTGLVSAAWVTGRLDVRSDLARRAAPVALPEDMFGGCLQLRTTVAPAFDAGFDTERSFAAKVVAGVRRRGPAWNSGLRDGMRLERWSFAQGDTSREVELVVRPARGGGRARTLAFWPYGDADAVTRKIQLQPGLNPSEMQACARRMSGL